MEFNSLENLVQQYLEQVPATRSDDFKLYFLVAADIYGDNGFNPTPGETDMLNLTIGDFMMNMINYVKLNYIYKCMNIKELQLD